MTKRGNPQHRKDSETVTSDTELMDMDISKMLEIDSGVTVTKTRARIEKTINGKIDSLRAEMKANQAELKNPNNEIQSNLDTLRPRVNEAEE